jgi:hypothetical protein
MLELLNKIPSDILKQMQAPSSMGCRLPNFPTEKINDIVKNISSMEFSKTSGVSETMLSKLFDLGFFKDPESNVLYIMSSFHGIAIEPPTPEKDGVLHLPSRHLLISNFTRGSITVTIGEGDDAITVCFPCLEASFQIFKAIYANDMDAIPKIYHSRTPGECKEFGNEVCFAEDDLKEWDNASKQVMTVLLETKIAQNDDIKEFLLSVKSLADVFGIPAKNIKYPEANNHGGKWSTGLDIEETLQAIIAGKAYANKNMFEECFGKAVMSTVYAEDLNPQSSKKARLSPTPVRSVSLASDGQTPEVQASNVGLNAGSAAEDSFHIVRTDSDPVVFVDAEDGEVLLDSPLVDAGPADTDSFTQEPASANPASAE